MSENSPDLEDDTGTYESGTGIKYSGRLDTPIIASVVQCQVWF